MASQIAQARADAKLRYETSVAQAAAREKERHSAELERESQMAARCIQWAEGHTAAVRLHREQLRELVSSSEEEEGGGKDSVRAADNAYRQRLCDTHAS